MQNKNRGAAMVEFALVVPFFFMLMCSIIYGGLVMLDIHNLNDLTRDAARYGAVQNSGIDNEEKRQNVIKYIAAHDNNVLVVYNIVDTQIEVKTDVDIKLNADDTTNTEKGVRVTVPAKLKDDLPAFLFTDYLPDSMKTISSTITMRRED